MNENETGACRGMRLFFNPGYRHGINNLSGTLLKKSLFAGCSKMLRCKAPEILSREAYFMVR